MQMVLWEAKIEYLIQPQGIITQLSEEKLWLSYQAIG